VDLLSGRGAAVAALLLLLLAGPAAAQGHGRGLGKTKGHGSTPEGVVPPPGVTGTGVRQFGVWLDDATISPAGRGWATFGIGYSRAPFGNQWDAPSVDAGVGVSPRVQLAVTAPFSKVSYTDGTVDRGLGDVYLAVKLGLIDPTATGRSFGLAVAPVVEFLSAGSVPDGGSRVHWALPVAVEKRFSKCRAYGTAGYFSRGSVFASGALEVPVTAKVTATATVSHSRSLHEDALSDAVQLARSRSDVSGGAVYFFSPSATFYASVGRTVSRLDANGSSLSVAAGVSFGFQHRIGGTP
jgi:hypothetical protein